MNDELLKVGMIVRKRNSRNRGTGTIVRAQKMTISGETWYNVEFDHCSGWFCREELEVVDEP